MNEKLDFYLEKFLLQIHELKNPEHVAKAIHEMTGYYIQYNRDLFYAYREFTLVSREIENSLDESTGKPMSSAKAKVLASASPQGLKYEELKTHVENIGKCIHSLEAFLDVMKAS